MNRFRQGVFIGVILSTLIVLAIALALSDERRQELRHRLEEIRNALPRIEQLKQSAQEAAAKARDAGSTLGEQVQASANKLAHRAQDLLATTEQKALSLDEK